MELEENAGWQEKEEQFHQENAIKRSQIRIEQNRYTAIDILAVNMIGFSIESKHHYKIQNPIKLILKLELPELAQLLNEIKVFIEQNLIGSNDKEKSLWNMALLYAQYIFNQKHLVFNCVQTAGNDDDEDANANANNLNESELKLMDKIERESLCKKGFDELVEFEELCSKMVSGKAAEIDAKYANISVDVNYWTLALKIAKVCKAKAFILQRHKEILSNLKREKQAKESNTEIFDDSNKSALQNESVSKFSIPEMLERESIKDCDIPLIDCGHSLYAIYKKQAVDADDDWDKIEDLRVKILKQSMEKLQKQALFNQNAKEKKKRKKENKERECQIDKARENAMYDREAKREMNDGEHSYNKSEEAIPSELRTTYWWHDKYRPRKPRYFNRVKTGYSWNKYNQTHYDPDNPPPKIVQGYKFNIFYPDLIDPLTAPTYKLYEKGEKSEYAILIFHAGPPYQDIAFKIVNNEWEPSHRRGFRCRFEKGIFSLYFNFMRYRYRR